MRLLLDAHAVIWSVDAPSKLSSLAKDSIADESNELFISIATIWEISIKVGIGKLKLSLPFDAWVASANRDLGSHQLQINIEHIKRQLGLPSHHRDPFDRLLIAQSITEGYTLVTADQAFESYGIDVLW
jgi:PIN domain nuclease of toxin-antitoxin system